jgi:hypothetical protein
MIWVLLLVPEVAFYFWAPLMCWFWPVILVLVAGFVVDRWGADW